MKHLKTFEKADLTHSSWADLFFRNKGLSKYLVTYNVTNYEATEEEWNQRNNRFIQK